MTRKRTLTPIRFRPVLFRMITEYGRKGASKGMADAFISGVAAGIKEGSLGAMREMPANEGSGGATVTAGCAHKPKADGRSKMVALNRFIALALPLQFFDGKDIIRRNQCQVLPVHPNTCRRRGRPRSVARLARAQVSRRNRAVYRGAAPHSFATGARPHSYRPSSGSDSLHLRAASHLARSSAGLRSFPGVRRFRRPLRSHQSGGVNGDGNLDVVPSPAAIGNRPIHLYFGDGKILAKARADSGPSAVAESRRQTRHRRRQRG